MKTRWAWFIQLLCYGPWKSASVLSRTEPILFENKDILSLLSPPHNTWACIWINSPACNQGSKRGLMLPGKPVPTKKGVYINVKKEVLQVLTEIQYLLQSKPSPVHLLKSETAKTVTPRTILPSLHLLEWQCLRYFFAETIVLHRGFQTGIA